MRRVQVCLAVVVLLTAMPLFAQSKAKVQNVPEIPFDSVPNALKLPDNLYYRRRHRHRHQLERARLRLHAQRRDAALRIRSERDLRQARSVRISTGSCSPTPSRVDKDDNIWAVDEGSNMVIKFDPAGKVLMLIGRRPEAVEGLEAAAAGRHAAAQRAAVRARPSHRHRLGCAGQHLHLRRLHQLARRQYDKFGKFIKSVGTRGAAPGQMNTPHGLQVDAKGNVYVADRGNARIQVFDNNLVLRAIYDHVGNPWTLCITPGPHQCISTRRTPIRTATRAAARDITGEVYKMELDGTVVGKFGKAGKQLKEFSTIHGLDCRNENELWVSEITAWRAQKIILHPQQAARPTTTAAR